MNPLKFHHIGYAVRNLEDSKALFIELGYKASGPIRKDKERRVSIAFLENGPVLVELVAPDSEGSPVTSLLKKVGSIPYHFCYEVDSLSEATDGLRKQGFVVVEKPTVAPALNGRKVMFLYHRELGLIELVGGSRES